MNQRVKLLVSGAIFVLLAGCPPTEPEPVYTYEAPGFYFVEGNNINDINAWRQANSDKHVLAFDFSYNRGFLVHYTENPGNSRQVFVLEQIDEYPYVLEVVEIQAKYVDKKIVDFCFTDQGIVLCLQDVFEPYEPSTK